MSKPLKKTPAKQVFKSKRLDGNLSVDKEEKIFRTYRDKALDLSRRNRLLKYPASAPKLEFDLDISECVNYFNKLSELYIEFPHKKILDVEAKRQRAEKEDKDYDEEDFDDGVRTVLQGEKLITQIIRLQRLSNRTFKEHGLNTLFLAVGEISWKAILNVRGSKDKVKEQTYLAPRSFNSCEFKYSAGLD